MKQLLFIYNPRSGKGLVKTYLSDIIDIMIRAGFEVIVHSTQGNRDATLKARVSADRFDRVVACGGDGTLDEVVTGIMESGIRVPIGYIPAGSTNDFGNSLGIDKELLLSARVAAGEKYFPCDVGQFNKDYFVYIAAFGLFTEVSYSTSQELKNTLGHVAYLLEGAKQLSDIPSYEISAVWKEGSAEGEFIYGMITNATSVGGFKGIVSGDISLNDGEFEVTLIRMPKNPLELSEIIAFLTGFNKETEMVLSFQTEEITVTSEEAVSWTLDGEFGGKHEVVVIKNLHEAMEILVE